MINQVNVVERALKFDGNIYILLTDTGTMFSRLIKQYTHAPYNHASISLDRELNQLYSFGRKEAYNPFFAGFVKEEVKNGIYDGFPHTECALYRVNVTKSIFSNIIKIIRQFELQKDKYSYNLIGLLGFILNRPIESETSYFCSQFVAEVLRKAGLKLWDKPAALVSPDDFRKIEHFELVYEGKLLDYYHQMVRRESIDRVAFQ